MKTEHHTPGPWKRAGELASHILDSQGRVIADAPHPHGMPAAEGYANARLIAAAPELLAGLIDLEDFVCAFIADYGTTLSAAERAGITVKLNRARAAIAKATGQQP